MLDLTWKFRLFAGFQNGQLPAAYFPKYPLTKLPGYVTYPETEPAVSIKCWLQKHIKYINQRTPGTGYDLRTLPNAELVIEVDKVVCCLQQLPTLSTKPQGVRKKKKF